MGQNSCCDEPDDLTSEAIFEQYRTRIYSHILHLVQDSTEAEDLTQETFLRVHRKLDSMENRATLGVWLYRIATNICYDRFRQSSSKHAAGTSSDALEPDDVDAFPAGSDEVGLDQAVEQAEMSDCVQEFLDQLSDDYRTVILLHDLQGLTNPEIAQMLGCSLATVKIRLHRARRRLREALEAGCDFSYDERGVFVCDRKSSDCQS